MAQAASESTAPAIGNPAVLLARVRERLAATPSDHTLGERLEADRNEREEALHGVEDPRVHD